MPQQDTVPVQSDLAPFAMIPRWLVDLADARAVLLYALLTDWEWRDENPTRAELADAMGVSPATIGRTLKALREAGAVRVIHQSRNGSQVESIYVLNHGHPEGGPITSEQGGVLTSDQGPGASPVSDLSSYEDTSDTRERAGGQPDLFGDAPGPASKGPRRKPERPIPDGWAPDGRVREWAAANVPGVDVDAEAGRFVDHALSVDRRARDWTAAFRNWLRKARPAPPGHNGGPPAAGRRYEGAESHDAGYWTPEGASLLVDEEDGRG